MTETAFQMTREDLDALVMKFREVKHSVNNHIAVIMALSELSQQNPAHVEKLIKAALARSPEIVNLLQVFQKELGAALTNNGSVAAQAPKPPV